jgi:hypothetical protein
LVAYSKQFSRNIGHNFNDKTIVLTAITGSAATEIGGSTTAKTFAYNRQNDIATGDDVEFFKDTRLNVVDEISFAGYTKVLAGMSAKLKSFTDCLDFIYGKHSICFLGDFCQLESIYKDDIYKTRNGIYWEQALNCMVELKGSHRFNECEEMKRIMNNIRNNELSVEDRKSLNSRVINDNDVQKPNPLITKYAVFYNEKRAELNASIFRKYLNTFHKDKLESDIPTSAIVLKANTKWGKSKIPLTFDQRKVLFEQCSESHVKRGQTQMCAPLLCLFSGCNLMVTTNQDVSGGIANGTTCKFRKVILKPEVQLEKIRMYDCWVNAISMEQIKHIEVEWQDCNHFVGTFKLKPETGIFVVQYPIEEFGLKSRIQTKIELQYIPVIVNNATTGHKLQGKTVTSLVIAEWSKVKNWAYVVLSRVKTLKGLFLKKPLPEDIDFSHAHSYLGMMKDLRQKILATPEQVSDLKNFRI